MKLELTIIKRDEFGRSFIRVDAEQGEHLYRHNHRFWMTRMADTLDEDARRRIIHDQRNSYLPNPYNVGAVAKLDALVAEARTAGPFSLLEIGAANGTAVAYLKRRFPDLEMTYTGFEGLAVLVDDFREKHPDLIIHQGDAETFVDAEPGAAPFTLFFAGVTLMMIKPALVERVLAKAAAATDQFLIYDFVDEVPVVPGDGEMVVVHNPKRPVYWFVHPWARILDAVGFEIRELDVTARTLKSDMQGLGFVHAVRKS